MILGLGKRYPSVEDEGNISIFEFYNYQTLSGILMGFGKRNIDDNSKYSKTMTRNIKGPRSIKAKGLVRDNASNVSNQTSILG